MDKINNNIPEQKNMPENKINFEVNPLDVNIAKMQFNLLSRCEKEIPENGDFTPVIETFKSKSPRLDLSEIKIICHYDKQNPGIKDSNRILSANISKANKEDLNLELFSGTKAELLEYLKKQDFFKVCKLNALN